MKFIDVENHIHLSNGMRIPQALNEMMWCKPLAEYFNQKYEMKYDEVSKDAALEESGIDVILSSSTHKGQTLLIQLTHAREYDMSPSPTTNKIDTTGEPIIDALTYKCNHYVERGINTEKILLIIQGAVTRPKMEALLDDAIFMRAFKDSDCFDGIYYISDEVYPLKDLVF